MIAVYCPRPSDGARELVRWFRAQGEPVRRVRRREGLTGLVARDTVVIWGQPLHYQGPARILNAHAPRGKYAELDLMRRVGLRTVEYTRTRPRDGEWLARTNGHQQGADLLAGLRVGDYYVRKENIHHEFRIHVFKNKGFRAGVKTPIPGAARVHPFIRTHPAGWFLSYRQADLDNAGPRDAARKAAIEAVAAVEYDFGAVDVGIRPNGQAVVFEVNSAPGLEGGTIERYGQKILAYHRGEL